MNVPLERLPEVKTLNKFRAALAYAELGVPILPCHSMDARKRCTCRVRDCRYPGYHPIQTSPWDRATTDPDAIGLWWAEWPSANLATPIGNTLGIAMLDIDNPEGIQSLVKLREQLGPMPKPACVSRSPSGGFHYYYPSLPKGGEWAPGVTALIEHPNWPLYGFYAMLPPSTTFARHEWI